MREELALGSLVYELYLGIFTILPTPTMLTIDFT